MTPETPNDHQKTMERRVTRADWFAGSALLIASAGIIYSAGLQSQRLDDHDRRLTTIEAAQASNASKVEQLLITTARIDANVSALADRAKDDRSVRK